MFTRLLKLPQELRCASDVTSLEAVIHAAAPCPIAIKERMIDWFGPILLEYYAATEANGFTFCDSNDWLAHKGTVGRALVGKVAILDDEGEECPVGTTGTVWFRGATNFEYFNDPAKTAESRNAEGDTSTVGDVGYLDEEGYLYLTDRKSHMIISGGVNIYPQETENLLITHPSVMDAAVIGVPDEDLGEAVKAVVEPSSGAEPGRDLEIELIAFCRLHLAHFKCPRTVDFVDELPRLPTGKLYKRLLRDRYWAEHATHIV
jgi:long-chain acyl-CoA synthetase